MPKQLKTKKGVKEAIVPHEWLESLLEHGARCQKLQDEESPNLRYELAGLLGYIRSAESILKRTP